MKLIAFWNYSTFPFCLWGEFIKSDAEHFWVKGYDGFAFRNSSRLALLPEIEAKLVIAKLEKLSNDKETVDKKFKFEAKTVLDSICGASRHELSAL